MLYTALLQHLGCTAYAHEVARVWGDDVVTTRVNFLSSSGEPKDIWRIWIPEMANATGRSKARVLATTVVTARRMDAEVPLRPARWRAALPKRSAYLSQCRWVCRTCSRCGMARAFRIRQAKSIPLAARVMQVALTAVMFASHANIEVAMAEVRRRAGTQLDPNLADVLVGTC